MELKETNKPYKRKKPETTIKNSVSANHLATLALWLHTLYHELI